MPNGEPPGGGLKMPTIRKVGFAPCGVSICTVEPFWRWWSFAYACEMKAPSFPSVSSVRAEPTSQFSLKTWLASGARAVNDSFDPRILASPARTPDTAITPGAVRAASSTLTGSGSKLFCASTA